MRWLKARAISRLLCARRGKVVGGPSHHAGPPAGARVRTRESPGSGPGPSAHLHRAIGATGRDLGPVACGAGSFDPDSYHLWDYVHCGAFAGSGPRFAVARSPLAQRPGWANQEDP